MLDCTILEQALELKKVFSKEEEATSAYDMGQYVDRAKELIQSFEVNEQEEESKEAISTV
jgi:hypothetical protein